MSVITYQDASMPIWFKTFGEQPFGEKSLFISLHGGGNVEPHVNDSQWENQKKCRSTKKTLVGKVAS